MKKDLKDIQKVTVRRAKQLRGDIHIPADVNAGEKFPEFAGFRFPLLDKKIY